MALPLYPAMVGYVLANLRACDAAEVWPAVPPNVSVDLLARLSCQLSPIGRVFLHDDIPAAAMGAMPRQAGVWDVWMFATDAWPHVWRDVVRYALGDMEREVQTHPHGAHRMQAHSRSGHPDAGSLLRFMGFECEGVARRFGGDGSDYETWARFEQARSPRRVRACA